jgi:hypothetical protein
MKTLQKQLEIIKRKAQKHLHMHNECNQKEKLELASRHWSAYDSYLRAAAKLDLAIHYLGMAIDYESKLK